MQNLRTAEGSPYKTDISKISGAHCAPLHIYPIISLLNRRITSIFSALFCGFSRSGSSARSSLAQFWARFISSMLQAISAIFSGGSPCCALPKKSPGPRIFKSSSLILKPSVVEDIIFIRFTQSSVTKTLGIISSTLMRMQNAMTNTLTA